MKGTGRREMFRRSRVWALVAMAAFLGLGWKLFNIQVLQHEEYRGEASKMQGRRWPMEAPRGNIYDRNGNPLALNLKLYSVAADPALVDDPEGIAAELGPLLRVPEASLTGTLEAKPGVRYVRLQDSVDQPAAEAIRELGCQGLIVNTQWKRAYPHGSTAASVLGFVGRDGEGLEGVEGARDDRLAGIDGEMLVVLDGRLPRSRAQIPERTIVTKQMLPGSSVVLTLELDIQSIVEEELAKAVENAKAAGGTAIEMDPETGEVLALARQPGFDPNQYREYPKGS
ncbi:MAG: hypothetical protein MUQ65_09330, partial [Armatimonadetes bacterium]|nr:hypothetical protein [Armatimonadota bacterium]